MWNHFSVVSKCIKGRGQKNRKSTHGGGGEVQGSTSGRGDLCGRQIQNGDRKGILKNSRQTEAGTSKGRKKKRNRKQNIYEKKTEGGYLKITTRQKERSSKRMGQKRESNQIEVNRRLNTLS